jgi:hypothetical protein
VEAWTGWQDVQDKQARGSHKQQFQKVAKMQIVLSKNYNAS